ncbi:CsbD family protein [Lacticaseibacillus thailandensis]|uniref:CsbD-like domain-containing protein n=1 Tax=Lacticaseibacillus thailandensis DSM 22698 = JCM 13996 TaxID=1423810 RepID=A0A0R2C8I7_9LACO|nr:CsbD family protein [Lacticaseibacillus thailandensis]KRM88175.1 hypothetical protein FD19_GL000465 [Lacticaseibacillus thailandensis DSM 22698 = JCM 13996]
MDAKEAKDKVAGTVKEQTGKLTGNETLEAKGKAQKLRGKARGKADDLKEKGASKLNDTVDAVTDDHDDR